MTVFRTVDKNDTLKNFLFHISHVSSTQVGIKNSSKPDSFCGVYRIKYEYHICYSAASIELRRIIFLRSDNFNNTYKSNSADEILKYRGFFNKDKIRYFTNKAKCTFSWYYYNHMSYVRFK
jgi:hypothetical protein